MVPGQHVAVTRLKHLQTKFTKAEIIFCAINVLVLCKQSN